ncbi:DUF4360 domain-containing protein [Pseudobacteriovorax antillogorgiicola]|uniref:DUF4360 domain-containing protein n=1 Tax=Pseudobacteriovorax antillogorgiicola TaxID=1513793 RepID=A0A1Y6CV14_9BACT|nr:DUF4360 domain-containing protein [Pseudobacteriovorax antillogorgiicola]TCS43610.1 uncharacterized protein DUF4360 [Pseudobacteriovorax antillogorgiicola]SMF80083.1 protein of unknown function [Pseudobacteriovorax antillogorgiicola]
MLRYLFLAILIISCSPEKTKQDLQNTSEVVEDLNSLDTGTVEDPIDKGVIEEPDLIIDDQLGDEQGQEQDLSNDDDADLNEDPYEDVDDQDPTQGNDPGQNGIMNGVSIDSITFEGDGCPAGSTLVNLAEDGMAFDVVYSEFIVEKVQGEQGQLRDCEVSLTLKYPQGWSFTLLNTAYRGAVFLEEGVSAQILASYGTNGSNFGSAELVIPGPIDESYTAPFDWQDSFKSSCDGTEELVIHTEIGLNGGLDREGFFTVDSLTGQLESTTEILWSRCDDSSQSD